MRDIGARIQRYRLSRYAPPVDRVRRRLRWAWVVGAVWAVWVGFLSEHSFYRLWQLSRENARNREETRRLAADIERFNREWSDAGLRRQAAETVLREQVGMARKGELIYKIQPR